MMSFVSFATVLLLGAPAANAFTMSVRPSVSASGASSTSGMRRADFLKQVVGATVGGAAFFPLASVAASSE